MQNLLWTAGQVGIYVLTVKILLRTGRYVGPGSGSTKVAQHITSCSSQLDDLIRDQQISASRVGICHENKFV